MRETTESIADFVNAEVKKIDERFNGIDSPAARAPTWEEYVVLTVGGIHPEGHSFPRSDSGMDAVRGWLAAFEEYAKTKTGRLYWRVRPEFDRIESITATAVSPVDQDAVSRLKVSETGKWQSYGRLLISDQPILPYEEYCARRIGLSKEDWQKF